MTPYDIHSSCGGRDVRLHMAYDEHVTALNRGDMESSAIFSTQSVSHRPRTTRWARGVLGMKVGSMDSVTSGTEEYLLGPPAVTDTWVQGGSSTRAHGI